MAAIVSTTNKKRDWGPDIEVLMFTPESEVQFKKWTLPGSSQGENEDGKQCPSNSMLGSAAVSRCSCLFPRFVSKIWNFIIIYAHEMLGDGHLDVKQC